MNISLSFLFFIIPLQEEDPMISGLIVSFGYVLVALFSLFFVFKFIEGVYVDFFAKKPLFTHFYLWLKSLNEKEQAVLKKQFPFYNKLNGKHQKYFQHRVCRFIENVDFMGGEGLEINEEKRILIAATATMLTFGYRNYNIHQLDKVILYSDEYYSNLNETFHKGEFNPSYRAIVFSWKDFKHGYEIEEDNLNLGIHEFVHAMHISYLKSRNRNDVSAHLFINGLEKIKALLETDEYYKNKMKTAGYFRDYAFTNQFELIAVLIENFMETPSIFKVEFPEIYIEIRQMLNFDFAGY